MRGTRPTSTDTYENKAHGAPPFGAGLRLLLAALVLSALGACAAEVHEPVVPEIYDIDHDARIGGALCYDGAEEGEDCDHGARLGDPLDPSPAAELPDQDKRCRCRCLEGTVVCR